MHSVCCRHFDDIPHRMVHFYIGGGPPKKQQQQQIVDRNGALKTFYVNPSLDWSRRITIFSKGLMKCKRGEIKKKFPSRLMIDFPSPVKMDFGEPARNQTVNFSPA